MPRPVSSSRGWSPGRATTADDDRRIPALSFSDWIGLLQTIVLAGTAIVGFRALRLTTLENTRLRSERRLQPRRELLLDVIRELKELAAEVETVTPGVGYFDSSRLAAQKHRLRVALEFFPPGDLPFTEAAADSRDLTQDNARAAVQPAAAELAAELKRLEAFAPSPAAMSRQPS